MNIVIPMAGIGSRFTAAGYTFPKPLIDVNGKPMIHVVVDNLDIDCHYIFVVQKEHQKTYDVRSMLDQIVPGCTVIEIDGVTEGACCTVLKAVDLIDNHWPLMIANSDQWMDWDSSGFLHEMYGPGIAGGICTFENTHPKWSYAKVNTDGFITEVAEKRVISNRATCGVYYWAQGSDFVSSANKMIRKDIRTNDEFYLCPVFNEAIADGMKIKEHPVKGMHGLGTPEDLDYYLRERG